MNTIEWLKLAGVMLPVVIALAIWMARVSSRLAVFGAQLSAMGETVERIDAFNRDRLCQVHAVKLEGFDRRLSILEAAE